MAKIKVEVDTKDGVFNVSINGESISNVKRVNCECYMGDGDKMKYSAVVSTWEKVADVVKDVLYITAHSKEAQNLVKAGLVKSTDDLIKTEANEVLNSDIFNFIRNRAK